jgi:hypothetical protein
VYSADEDVGFAKGIPHRGVEQVFQPLLRLDFFADSLS